MIRSTGIHLMTESRRTTPRFMALLGLLFAAAPVIQSQTKPSDVFFGAPSELQIAEETAKLTSIGQEVGKNFLSPHSIVAKDVVLRGWLTCAADPDTKNPNWICPGAVVPNKDIIGIADMHYELMVDYDFINSTYGANAGVLNGAMLPGDGPHTWEAQATPIPMKNPLAKTVSGIDINSFWLPYGNMPNFHVELNAWHPDSSHHGCQWPLPGTPVLCSAHNFEGRGRAPAGWIEKDYGSVEPNSSHNWWPFDPDNPDGLFITEGTTVPKNLQIGNYVEMKGTLWQDISHATGVPPAQYCWNEAPFQNHGGWLELHPVDSIRRVSAPGLSPYDAPGESARQGMKRIIAVALCSDANGNSGGTVTDGSTVVCPDSTQIPTSLVPHMLPELTDGRFTDSFLLSQSEVVLTHHIQVDSKRPDCVDITARLAPGVKSAHFKATYVVWWTPPAPPAIMNQPANNVVSLNQNARFAVTASGSAPLTYQWHRNGMVISGATSPNYATPPVTPFDLGAQFAVVVSNSVGSVTSSAATIIGQMSATVSTTGPKSPVTDTITVTSGGMPLAGVTVTSGNSTFVTNASGVVVMTHTGCVKWNGPVPKVGDTKISPNTPVPCNWTGTASKAGYQTINFSLP